MPPARVGRRCHGDGAPVAALAARPQALALLTIIVLHRRHRFPAEVIAHIVTSTSRTCVQTGAGSRTTGADGGPKRKSSSSPVKHPGM